jgi:hypothetical protein
MKYFLKLVPSLVSLREFEISKFHFDNMCHAPIVLVVFLGCVGEIRILPYPCSLFYVHQRCTVYFQDFPTI